MLVVQKYGGTSVGNLERIEAVARRIISSVKDDKKVVAVVSAMSGETNKLMKHSKHFTQAPPQREVDVLLSCGERVTISLLAIAINSMGYNAISMTGRQAGIITDAFHTKARIEKIDATRILKALESGIIPIIAGFQGITAQGNVSTLGRGGSDLTAVALANRLNADLCEIYTDVDGVYTTDPRIESKAKKLNTISYDEMLELSSLGAKVLQARAVELAKKLDVKVVTRNSFNKNSGTLIVKESKEMENLVESPVVRGISLDNTQSKITLRAVKDEPGIAAKVFMELAKRNINVNMIVQSVGFEKEANISFTVLKEQLKDARKIIESIKIAKMTEHTNNICIVSVVGIGMKTSAGIAAKAFATFAEEKINIKMISTSEIKISMAIDSKYGELAVRALHKAYKLGKKK